MKHYQQTLASLDRAIALSPDDARVIARRGEIYGLLECYGKALADFNRAIGLVPDYAWAIAHRGETYRLMECYQAALADFNRAIELSPGYVWAIAHRGATHRLIEDYDEALADFSQAIELNPSYGWAWAYRARTYELINRYEETLADFDRAIALDQTLFDNWRLKRGMMLSYLGRYAEAIACCRQVLLEHPEDAFALYNMAVFKIRWQGLAEARVELHIAKNTLLAMADSEVRGIILYRLGGLAALEGKTDQALTYLEEAISLDENEVVDYAQHDTAWLDLRSEPRFQLLIAGRRCELQLCT